jgi:RND superfamily putative drug exporter
MFEKLGHSIYKHRKAFLGIGALIVLVMGGLGSLAIPRLQNGGYNVPHSASEKATNYLTNQFGTKDPVAVIVITPAGAMNSPQTINQVAALEGSISHISGVSQVISYWDAHQAPQLASPNGKIGLAFVYTNTTDLIRNAHIGHNILTVAKSGNGIDVKVDGMGPLNDQLSTTITKDLSKAEMISIPITFFLLLFIFGGLISSAMPLVVGISSIFGALFILWIITLITPVSIFALNLTTGLGLGLGIDYSLLIVNRFREELNHGKSVEEATVITLKTAGRTVLFSGITVLATLASLLFFPLMFLKSFGYAGIAVVLTAVAGANLLLPALLAILGHNINKYTVRKKASHTSDVGRWNRFARFVMKRPIAISLLEIIFISAIASPVRSIIFSQEDARTLPASNTVAAADAYYQSNFPGQSGSPIEIILTKAASDATIGQITSQVSSTPGIIQVLPATRANGLVRIQAIESMQPHSAAAQNLINTLRKNPLLADAVIGGQAALYTDTQEGISKTLPRVGIWIALSILVLLFLFTGSVILPIKAVLLNGLSLTAMLGAINYVFGMGHFKWLVGGFTVTHSLSTSMVILIAITTFGLSMDYEVFLLSRIREEHELGRSTEDSVAFGLQKSARIITAAALLLAVVFSAFITSGVTNIKTLGFGVALAILLDATVIRAILVPALMALFGKLNWWAPKSLSRFTIKH